jgi:DNA-binding CsgD family transcriptional regulator
MFMKKISHLKKNTSVKMAFPKNRKRASRKFNVDVEKLLFLPGKVSVYWKDFESFYLGCNDIFAETVKFASREACLGLTDYDYDHPVDEANFVRNNDQKVIISKQPQYFPETITINDYRLEVASLKLPLRNLDAEVIGVLGISYHLAEYNIKEALPALSDSNIPLEKFSLESISNFSLSRQQIECLLWLIKGMTIKQIAKKMNLSPRTIESYLEVIKKKLHCSSRTELIEKALKIPAIRERLF